MTWAGTGPSGYFWTLNIGGGTARIDWEPAAGDVSGLIDSLLVVGLQGNPISNATPIFGDVLFFDGLQWVPAASGTSGSGVGPHNLLSVTHTDTLSDNPNQGDIITGSGTSAVWARFSIGEPLQSLTTNESGLLEWSGLGLPKTEIFTSGTFIQLDNRDRRVLLNKSVSEPVTVNLPTSPVNYQEILIKDIKGDAATNNITVVPQSGSTIDGFTQIILGQNYQSFTLLWHGINWSII